MSVAAAVEVDVDPADACGEAAALALFGEVHVGVGHLFEVAFQARQLALSLPDSINRLVLASAQGTRIGGPWFQQLRGRDPGCPTTAASNGVQIIGRKLAGELKNMGYPFIYWPNSLMMNNRNGTFSDVTGNYNDQGPTHVRTWYPPFCVVADVVIGLPLLAGWVL